LEERKQGMTATEIINTIKTQIASNGLSYVEIGEPIDMSRQQVYNVLNGNPTLKTLIKVAESSGVEIVAQVKE